MFSSLLLVACLSASTLAIVKPYYDIRKAPEYFNEFMQKYDKTYKFHKEKQHRFEIFVNNLKMVNKLNKENEVTAFGITQFMDLTMEEIVKDHTGLGKGYIPYCPILQDDDIDEVPVPDSWDWRNRSVVSRVKDQGKCSSSWTFSASGQLESLYAIKYGKKIEISERQAMDCDYISDACCGGTVSGAFLAYQDRPGGIVLSKDYPYQAERLYCGDDFSLKGVARITNCHLYLLHSQEKLKQLLYQHGPVSVAIKSSGLTKHYLGGILTDNFCEDGDLDHWVLLVGYGTENNVPYWILKNSWGEDFGEGGYFRIQRGNVADSCGMMNIYTSTVDIYTQ